MDHGAIVEEGPPEQIFRTRRGAHPRLHRRDCALSPPWSLVALSRNLLQLEVIERYFPAIMKGVVVTMEIAAAVVVTGILSGCARDRPRFRVRAVNALIVVFVDMFRALPPLVLVLLVYFGLPNIGINLPSFAVLWLVLSLVLAAFARRFSGPASCRCRRANGRPRVRPG